MDQHSKFADLEINGAKTKSTTFRHDIKLSVTTESGVTAIQFIYAFTRCGCTSPTDKDPHERSSKGTLPDVNVRGDKQRKAATRLEQILLQTSTRMWADRRRGR